MSVTNDDLEKVVNNISASYDAALLALSADDIAATVCARRWPC